MRIRSITCFINPGNPPQAAVLQQAGRFAQEAKVCFENAGYIVQSTRLATVPFGEWLPLTEVNQATELVVSLERQAHEAGFDYLAIGPARPEEEQAYGIIPTLLATTSTLFTSGMMTGRPGQVHLKAVRHCAEVIHKVAHINEDGFANLRFAALANVPAGAPFFPAAYHQGQAPGFALAMEAADLAVEAFTRANDLDEAAHSLTHRVEEEAQTLSRLARELAFQLGFAFKGIDFTLAPFPEEARSIGNALERFGVPCVGLHGTLAASALLTSALDRAAFPRAGFNGLMLPVLEDATLAQRAAEGTLEVTDLLLYAAVCGTGLDTLPLPGEVSVEQLYALLLDLAALAQRLDKPLTARLMPLPGKKAGDPTAFAFAYFANSRVMALKAQPLGGLLVTSPAFSIQGREKRKPKPK